MKHEACVCVHIFFCIKFKQPTVGFGGSLGEQSVVIN